MRKTLVIAVREYQAAVRTKAFIITLVAMPVLFGGSFIAMSLLEDRVDTTPRKLAVVDNSGILYETLRAAAQERNQTETTDAETGRKIRPDFILERVEAGDEAPDALRLKLSDRVREEDIFAFLEIGAHVVDPDGADLEAEPLAASVVYYSNNPVYDDLRHWLRPRVNERVQALRFEAAALPKEVVGKAIAAVRLHNRELVTVDEATGEIQEAKESNELAGVFVPLILMMLMFMMLVVGAIPLLNSVLEEKMQRIAEVLLGSVTPFRLMMGKLVGMVGVSLTIVVIYWGGGLYAAYRAGYADYVPRNLIGWFVVYQALSMVMFGSIFVAVGAACSDYKETQSALMPVWLVMYIPLFVWIHVIREPGSTFSTVLSFLPTATPMLMLVRQAAYPALPVWQPYLGIVLVLLTTVLFVFAAGRIFRVGILMQGKGPKMGEMLRWVFKG